MYREDETVAVVIKIDKYETFMERVRIDPNRWTSSVTSLMKNVKHVLTVKGIDKTRINELCIEIANVMNQNYTIFRDLVKEDSIRRDSTSNDKKSEDRRESTHRVTLAETVVDIACLPENTELFFRDQLGTPYAAIRTGKVKHLEIISLKSSKYKYFLTKIFRESNGQIITSDIIKNAVNALVAIALFDSKTIPLHLRVAWGTVQNRCNPGCIYYDMTDESGGIIELSTNGWRIIHGTDSNIPILFKRHNQIAQVQPDRNYPTDIFDQFLNLTNVKNKSHRHLLKAYIVSLFIPNIDHTILTIYGPQGSAKSFLLRLIKELVDPSKPVLLTLLRNIPEFIQQVNHNYLVFYDNVKYIPYWLSDEICKAITGIGHTKRELYSDDEDVIYEHRRCISLNGINVALIEPDALDRSLFIEQLEIDDENRKKKEDLFAEFERIKPNLLAYILDTLVKAMQIKPKLKLTRLSRMADFTEWSEAISQAIGYKEMSFVEAYNENRNEQNVVAVNENTVGCLFVKFWNDYESKYMENPVFAGSPDELYRAIVDFAEENEININNRQFPKTPEILIKKLNTVKPNLKQGFSIIVKIERDSRNYSAITVCRGNREQQQNPSNPLLNQAYAIQILHNRVLR